MNQHAKDVGQRSFRSTIIARTHTERHTDTHTPDQLLYLDH